MLLTPGTRLGPYTIESLIRAPLNSDDNRERNSAHNRRSAPVLHMDPVGENLARVSLRVTSCRQNPQTPATGYKRWKRRPVLNLRARINWPKTANSREAMEKKPTESLRPSQLVAFGSKRYVPGSYASFRTRLSRQRLSEECRRSSGAQSSQQLDDNVRGSNPKRVSPL